MLRKVMLAAARWHTKVNQMPTTLPVYPLESAGLVDAAVQHMLLAAKDSEHKAQQLDADPRWLRIALWLEECAEKVKACCDADALGTLDGIADSIFVDAGAAYRFSWDLDGAYREVVRSNETKTFSGDVRVRDKGPNYSPPDLRSFL